MALIAEPSDEGAVLMTNVRCSIELIIILCETSNVEVEIKDGICRVLSLFCVVFLLDLI